MENELVHVCEQVVAPELGDPVANRLALVRRHDSAIGKAVGSVRRRERVVLAVQVAVLGVGAIAEVGPETVKGPLVGRQLLAGRLEAGVCVPELGRKEKTTEGLGAAGVHAGEVAAIGDGTAGEEGVGCRDVSNCSGRTTAVKLTQLASVIEVRLAVERGSSSAREGSDSERVHVESFN